MNPEWPSVKEQLLVDRVPSNSALEKLIKENQEFDLLQPQEADDDVGLPLWLRVYWRKKHPDLKHPTVNPGAGYPDVLYDMYARMVAHPDLPWSEESPPSESSRKDVQKHGRNGSRP